MRPALSQVCTLSSPFERDVEEFAAGQCDAIEVWLTKLETYLQSYSTDDLTGLLQQHGVTIPVGSFQGGLLTSQGEQRKEAWSLFIQRLEICRQIGLQTLVVAGDINAPIEQRDVERAQSSLQQVAEEASKFKVKVALEFQGRAAFCNNLQTAAALVSDVGSPYLGICLDVFHFYVGPSKIEDLELLTSENLFHVQLCDLADVPREFATDADRILPGDGDFQLVPLIDHLRAINYDAHVSVELMNPHIWQVPPLQFGEIGMTALRKTLGLASME